MIPTYNKILNAQQQNKTKLCVGLDTDMNKIPEFLKRTSNGMLEFNKAIIEKTYDVVCAYKLNFAFYEQYGIEGMEVIRATIDHIPSGIPIIADCKREDIGNTSISYAHACFDYFKCDAVTVSPYMGKDSIQPFFSYSNKLVLVLALTSNPGSADFQRLISEGKPIYRHVIEKTSKWAEKENLGYVVGATHPQDLSEIRDDVPDRMLLIPGIGAQGGSVEETLHANGNGPAMINVSRDIIYASHHEDFAAKAREKAITYNKFFNR
jgi:orotidine-5'-phosphate decarboxylase